MWKISLNFNERIYGFHISWSIFNVVCSASPTGKDARNRKYLTSSFSQPKNSVTVTDCSKLLLTSFLFGLDCLWGFYGDCALMQFILLRIKDNGFTYSKVMSIWDTCSDNTWLWDNGSGPQWKENGAFPFCLNHWTPFSHFCILLHLIPSYLSRPHCDISTFSIFISRSFHSAYRTYSIAFCCVYTCCPWQWFLCPCFSLNPLFLLFLYDSILVSLMLCLSLTYGNV